MGAQADLGRGRAAPASPRRPVGRDELLDDRGLRAVAEDDQGASDQGPRCPERPAEHDGPVDADAGRHVDDHPGVQAARESCAELLVRGEQRRAVQELAGERLVGPEELGQRHEADAGARAASASDTGRRRRPRELDASGDLRREPRRRRWRPSSGTARPRRATRRAGPRTACRAGCSRPAAPRRRRARRGGRRAARRARRRASAMRVDEGAVDERERQLRGPAGRAPGARRAGDDGSATSVIRGTPPSPA